MRQQHAIKAAQGGKTVVPQRAHAPQLRSRHGSPALASMEHGVSNHVLLRRQEKALQAKLTVGAANDAYEQEANRVAEKVMRMPEPNTAARSFAPRDVGLSSAGPHASTSSSLKSAGVDSLQRKCSCGGADGECEECRKKRLQREVGNSGLQVHGGSAVGAQESQVAPPIVHDVLRSPGRPLDAETRAFMEPRFGQDFSNVRIHTDAKAAESARAVNAEAYTVGEDVVFASRRYEPQTELGQTLIAHELIHVLQQGLQVDNALRRQTSRHKKGRTSSLSVDQVRSLVDANNNSSFGTELLICLIWKESNFDPRQRSRASSATGLMQITRQAVTDVNRNTPKGIHFQHSEMTDAAKNISCGTFYLNLLLGRFGDTTQALNHYGTGEGYADDIVQCETCMNSESTTEPSTCLHPIHT